MSRRKNSDDLLRDRTAADAAIRAKQESKAFELGVPLTPEYLWNNRKLHAYWKKNVKKLLGSRLLAYADGDALLEFCKAELAGQSGICEAIWESTWANREPFPDPHPAGTGETLDEFLLAVQNERQSFTKRMLPADTVCLDSNNVGYAWPEGDAATISRRHALDMIESRIVVGELAQLAAKRFLSDLESGWERGLYFDPVAARHVCMFAERFSGLKLMAWQVFALSNLFGWKRASGLRRFSEGWLSCGKKNGKTRIASVVALFGLVCDGEKFPDCFAAATSKDQSRLVWRDARRCVGDNPELCAHVQRWAGVLAVKDTDGSFTPLSSDEKSMDGLRPHFIIADEVSFWSDREIWDKLVKGVVSRAQPLTFAITTAGKTKQCFAFGKFASAERILRGVIKDDTTFVLIYRIDATDKWDDESCWPKANPSLGVTLRIEHLKKTRDEALEDPSGLNAFMQYHLNIWPEVNLSRQGSIVASKWDKCSGLDLIGERDLRKAITKFLELNRDTPCFLGVDIGLTSDLSAVAMLWPRARFAEGANPITRAVAVVQCFMPEVGVLAKEKSWSVPLSQWVREQWIDLLPGDMTDPKLVQKHVVDLHETFTVREVGYDPWQWRVEAAELCERGIQCVEVPQLPSQLTTPIHELMGAINRSDLVHFGNPLLSWMASNVVFAESEKHGGTKPEKIDPPHSKIDGVQALLSAWHRMLAAPPPSVYAERGIITF